VWDGPYDDAMCADVTYVEALGTYKIITLKLAGQLRKVRLQEDKLVPQGQAWMSFPGNWLMLYADDYLLEAGTAREVSHA
ncbi:ABC transporter ATP-binding protein, partial [Pseudomonas syringae pv. tagetis]